MSTRVFQLFQMSLFSFSVVAVMWSPFVSADELSEEKRLQGFAEHQKANRQFDRDREQHSDEIKAQRNKWEEERLKSLNQFKASKKEQAQGINESSLQYKEDVLLKKRQAAELEKLRQEYVAERDFERKRKKTHIHLSESEELGLDQPVERVEIAKRALYGGKPSYSGKVDFAGTPPASGRGAVAPPPPHQPDFFEPEPPPVPPPMPEPVFEDAIPPPIFDDPGDF